jgi:hypothetical protein
MQSKTQLAKPKLLDTEQVIDFLKGISELLKNQHRHFDDAVVSHCIRLVSDYKEDSKQEAILVRPGAVTSGRRS